MRKPTKPSLESFAAEENTVDALRAANMRLQRQLAVAKERSEDLVAATLQGARDAYLSVPHTRPPEPPKERIGRGKPEGALWVLGDWQGAKALADDTPVLTPSGWKRHGDLRPGDFVFSPSGTAVPVLGVTGSAPQSCSRVMFDGGISIVASDDHEWEGWRRYKLLDGRYERRRVRWTTRQVGELRRVRRENREYNDRAFHVDLPVPLQMPRHIEVPVEPYVFGLWLGDGSRDDDRIAVGEQDIEHARAYGRVVKYPSSAAHRLKVPGLRGQLRAAGLLGGDKTIPAAYLCASTDQRLALLQGLMDTDGTIDARGHASFVNTRRHIADAVADLALSLGMKVARSQSVGTLNGEQKKLCYNVRFVPQLPVFRLARKAARIKARRTDQMRYRFVQRVEPVGVVYAQCITVEGGLYLAGRDLVTTHNCTVSYNSDVMRARVRTYWEKARKITEIQRADHPVRVGAVLFGGDMVEGLFNFPRQPFEIDASLFGQWASVSQLVLETVEAALATYQEVYVWAEWGNHGRIGSKRDAVPRSDNLDRMVYEHARQMLKGRVRLHWEDCPEDIQRVELGNYRALLIHGDEAGRNGYVSAQTMVQHVNRWRSGAYPWEFRDCYVHHYHRHAEEPLANGEGCVYWTGSTESDNRYALEQMAASAKPSQRLHFVDLAKGRISAQYKVYV